MRVIHFTVGAGDPLWGAGVSGVDFVPMLTGDSAFQLGCLHLSKGAVSNRPAPEHACALLVVQGLATLLDPCRIDLSGGMGIVVQRGEGIRLESRDGAVLLVLECAELEATEVAISTPERISGQRWPGEVGPQWT